MQDRFERFVVSITELHRYLQKLKELEMGQMDLKAGYTMCLYYLGKHPEGLTATQLTELCKEDKAAISRTLSQLSSKGLVSCELPEHKRSYRT
ncbi:MarR family transcriptional regulator, partial [Waltera sp.]